MAKKSKGFRRIRLIYLRQFPRRKHMHGGLLHRLLGESLFDRKLWKPDKSTFAVGMSVGLFIGMLPTYYIQIILAVALAYVLRVNITAAVLGTLVTNPLTTLPIVGLQYKIGVWLIGPPDPAELERYHGILRVVLGHGKPYLIGSIITAVLSAILGYFAVVIFWKAGAKVVEVRHKIHDEHAHKAEELARKAEEKAHKTDEAAHKADGPAHKADGPAHKADGPAQKSEQPTHKTDQPAHKSDEPTHKADIGSH